MTASKPQLYRFGSCKLSVANQELLTNGKTVKVQQRVFDLLIYLIEHRDRIVGKDELLEQVWAGRVTMEAVLARAVMKARKALADDSQSQSVIKTVHGQGYRFVAKLQSDENVIDSEPEPTSEPLRPGNWQQGLRLTGIAAAATLIALWFLWQNAEKSSDRQKLETINTAISVNTWRQAEALFQRDPFWRGGDGALSADMGSGRMVWFFSDSFISSAPDLGRRDSEFVRNSVGIQQGYDPASAQLEFFWKDNTTQPGSFFSEKGDSWFWPVQALVIDQQLLLFQVESKAIETGLGFEHLGMVLQVIRNPADSPDDWRIDDIKLPENKAGILLAYSAIIKQGEHVYAFSKQERSKDVYLARWLSRDLTTHDASIIQWWCGTKDGWMTLDSSLAVARPVLSDTPTPFSVRYNDELKKFLMLGSWGFGSAVITLRSAATLTGPWSDRQVIYHPEEEFRPGIMIYGGIIQDGLIGADLVATYDVNSEVFSELVNDTSLYFPRFLRIDISSSDAEP